MGPWALFPALAVLAGAVVEMRVHGRRLQSIPHRIHVNGTRGKSSVVRLIAAGLREGGLRVVAKTTGSVACLILPDGQERDLRGRRRPSLREYLAVTSLAARSRADAVVAECMALRPEYQRAAERMLRSTIGVLTAAGLDHVGVVGDTLDDIAVALSETIPTGGVLVTPGPAAPPSWAQVAAARDTEVRAVVPEPGLPMPEHYLEWPENVALALAACEAAGVPRETALAGMHGVRPDPGALRVWVRYTSVGATTWFVGAFGANDPISTRRIVARVRERYALDGAPTAGVLNTRADRGERTLQWCQALAAGALSLDRLVLAGPHAPAAARLLARQGWDARRLVALAHASAAVLTDAATSGLPHSRHAMVVGMGNIRRTGAVLMQHWARLGQELIHG